MLLRLLVFLLLLSLPLYGFSDVTLTEAEYNAILTALNEAEKTLNELEQEVVTLEAELTTLKQYLSEQNNDQMINNILFGLSGIGIGVTAGIILE